METKCFRRRNNLFPLLKTLSRGPDYIRKWHIYNVLSKMTIYDYGSKSTDYVGSYFRNLQTNIV